MTLEERRHRRECLVLLSALDAMFDLFAADLMNNSARLQVKGAAALPSFRKGYSSIAALPHIILASLASRLTLARTQSAEENGRVYDLIFSRSVLRSVRIDPSPWLQPLTRASGDRPLNGTVFT